MIGSQENLTRKQTNLVSIGLPVYNGVNYIEEAIQSVLTQTYRNFELIICDNASTDTTPEICQNFAVQDNRIRYYRNEKNLGAGANYDRCFHLSNGDFFKWIAHDDTIESGYLEHTVEVLLQNPEAICCVTEVMIIDENGEPNGCWIFPNLDLSSNSSERRFRNFIFHRGKCTHFFGMYRKAALEDSVLHGNYKHSDNVFLAEMALRGKTIRIDRCYFMNRVHPEQYSSSIMVSGSTDEVATWWKGESADKQEKETPYTRLWINYYKIVYKSKLLTAEKFQCYFLLMKWGLPNRGIRRITVELLKKWSLPLYNFLRNSKKSIFGR